MTMSIRIKNEDQARTAKVAVTDFNATERGAPQEYDLPPGEEKQIYIHAGRDVLVTEKVE